MPGRECYHCKAWIVTWAGFFVPIAFFAGCSVAYRSGNATRRSLVSRHGPFLADGWLVPPADAQSVVSHVNLSNFRGVVPMETPTLTELLTGSRGSFAIAYQLNDTTARTAGSAAFALLAGTLAGTRVHVRLLLTASVFIRTEMAYALTALVGLRDVTPTSAVPVMLLRCGSYRPS